MSLDQVSDLDGQIALVTGATSGLGKAIALRLARAGAEVIVHGRDATRGAQTVTEIEAIGGKARFVETEMGLPLGVACGSYSECAVELPVGSRVVLYSDGITEAARPDDEEYGPARLTAHMQLPEACLNTLLEEVRRFVNGTGLHDDATVIMLKA